MGPARRRGTLRVERSAGAARKQVGLGQIRSCVPENVVFLLQQLDPLTRLGKRRWLGARFCGRGAFIGSGFAEPFLQRHRMNAELCGDMLDRHTGPAVQSDPYSLVT